MTYMYLSERGDDVIVPLDLLRQPCLRRQQQQQQQQQMRRQLLGYGGEQPGNERKKWSACST